MSFWEQFTKRGSSNFPKGKGPIYPKGNFYYREYYIDYLYIYNNNTYKLHSIL
jgi:hypothetical protein